MTTVTKTVSEINAMKPKGKATRQTRSIRSPERRRSPAIAPADYQVDDHRSSHEHHTLYHESIGKADLRYVGA